MKLTTENLRELADLASEAAKEAGALIREYSNRPVDVMQKEGGESLASQVLTEVDGLSQDMILQALRPVCEPYDLALLSEESEDDRSRFEKDYFWCIDPLDGTLSFIEQTPGYSVSIALVSRSGEPLIGVVYDPVEHHLYHAFKGGGAFRNGHPLPPNTRGQILNMVADRSFFKQPNRDAILGGLEQIAEAMELEGVETGMHGGAAMNACWVLQNGPACYFKFPRPTNGGGSVWDFAATACIFSEAGAIATDIHGEPLDLNRADSTFMNHRGILFATSEGLALQIRELYKKQAQEINHEDTKGH